MTIDDVLEWIALQNAAIAIQMANLTPFEKANHEWERLSHKCEILQELRHHILMKTNPHNREDIAKVNEREDRAKIKALQYEILKFLSDKNYHLNVDDEESAKMATEDSYKIMEMIKKHG